MLYTHYYRIPLIICMLACFLSCTISCLVASAAGDKKPALTKPHAKSHSSRSRAASSSARKRTKKVRVVKTKSAKVQVAKLQAPRTQLPKTVRTLSVSEWFDKYDQIRRDAEMTMADKWQSMLLQAKKPAPANAALAVRMSSKYSCALSAMKRLGSPPETKALHVGYIEYFGSARQLFQDYLVAQNVVPFSNQSLAPTKKKLEVLDKRNKQIDNELRKEYIIKKHRHS